jgi:O-antigen ligase
LTLAAGATSSVSRTGVLMFAVVAIVYLCLRPRETLRLWPALVPALVLIHLALPGTLGSLKNSFMPSGGLVAQQKSDAGQSGSGRLADLGPGLRQWQQNPLFGEGYATRDVSVPDVAPSPTGELSDHQILDDQWLGTLLETGAVGFVGWLWFFARAVRRFGREAARDHSARGWLLTALTAGIAAYGIGMLTFDAFGFIQVTFLLFIFVGLGSALMADSSAPVMPITRTPRRRTMTAVEP